MSQRRIAVFTGTRADYGLLRGLAIAIAHSPDAELILIAAGSHHSEPHGRTVSEIFADGLDLSDSVPVWSGDDTAAGAAADVGRAVESIARVLEARDPDVLVVLGDRLEAFAAATAALVLGVPIAHIHGGELTEGAMDDALRHAITKFAWLHLVSTEEHRRRVMQLGESPSRVHFLGAPIVDALADMDLLDADELAARFGVRFERPTALVTFHPAAMDVLPAEDLLEELLAGLIAVEGLDVIITGSNTDIGSNRLRERIAEWVRANSDRVTYIESFGQLGYLSVMAHAAVVVGNSSSTVLEAPVLGVPSVLVGDRQLGRPIAASVSTPEPEQGAITAAIRKASSHRRDREPEAGIFGEPGFAAKALELLLTADLPRFPRKPFVDTENGCHGDG